ncbi:MAG: ATP synthase F1 subunit epsilon [Alphaproteobacteria bacterium]
MSKILFTLVSPSKKLYSAEADMVIIPAAGGDIGVMKGHSPVLGTVRAGTIIVKNGNDEVRLFVESGFMEVNAETATVLAEHGVAVSELNKADVEKQLKTATENLSSAKEDDKEDAKALLGVAKARLSAVNKSHY